MQMEAPFKRANAGLINSDEAWREAIFALKRMAAFCLGIYFVFCWLGAQSGGNAVWLSRLPITLTTVCAITLADFGSAAFGATLPPEARLWWGRSRTGNCRAAFYRARRVEQQTVFVRRRSVRFAVAVRDFVLAFSRRRRKFSFLSTFSLGRSGIPNLRWHDLLFCGAA